MTEWFDCRPDWMFWVIIAVVATAAFSIGAWLA